MPKKIILDCDPGHDDAVAIMLAIASDDIDLLGITCVGGNATLENTKLNALKICSLLKREDIPIYAGSDKPLKYDLVTNAKKALDAGCNLVLYCEGNIKNNFKLIKSVPYIDKFTAKKTSEIYKILR